MPLEKYSAFSWPKLCSWSGFAEAYVSTASAMSAARMFTTDSTASESRPTEPVRKYAANLSAMTDNRGRHRDPRVEGGRTRAHAAPFSWRRMRRAPSCTHEALERLGDRRQPPLAAMDDVPLAHDGESLDGDDGEAAERKLLLHRVRREES